MGGISRDDNVSWGLSSEGVEIAIGNSCDCYVALVGMGKGRRRNEREAGVQSDARAPLGKCAGAIRRHTCT